MYVKHQEVIQEFALKESGDEDNNIIISGSI